MVDDDSYGYVTAMTVISESDGFFVSAASATDNTLYHFNPTTGAVNAVEFNTTDASYMQHKSLSNLALDKHDRLWIGNRTDKNVVILNTTPIPTGAYKIDEDKSIPVGSSGDAMAPEQIVFCLEPEIADAHEAAKPASEGESGNFCFVGVVTDNK